MPLTLILLLLTFCRWTSLAPTPTSPEAETGDTAIAQLAGELIRELELPKVDQAEHYADGHLHQHNEGYSHEHHHQTYDGHRHVEQLHQHDGGVQHAHGENHRHVKHQHQHDDGSIHDHLLPIYDSIRNEQADILTQIERLYSAYQSHSSQSEGHEYPLVRLVASNPNSMTLMVSPKVFQPDVMIRLLYERVPMNRKPCVQHLDDPVVEYHPMIRDTQTYTLSDLPRGKYIVCGEAMDQDDGEIVQASCLETQIERRHENRLQEGVQAMIIIAFLVVALVVLYAVLYQVYKKKCASSSNRKKQEKK